MSFDAEAIVLLPDGRFFVSDEYGPYIYRFSPQGRMPAAIRPPEGFIPRWNGQGFRRGSPTRIRSGVDLDTVFLVYRITLPGLP